MSRGARYNSALKYLNASKGKRKCLIVIISEDGMIDIKTEEDRYMRFIAEKIIIENSTLI